MRFVIIGNQRTGSNYLVSLLKSHPDIICYGELFRKKYEINKFIPNLPNSFVDIKYRKENYKKLFENLDRYNVTYKYWGFKIFPEHYLFLIKKIIKDNNCKILYLSRKNLLAQYSSLKIAKQSKIFFKKIDLNNEYKNTTNFDAKEFDFFINKMNTFDDLIKSISINHKQFFKIKYEELFNLKNIEKILEFLNLDTFDLNSKSDKILNRNIISRFDNPNDCIKYLEKYDLKKWLYE